MSEILRCFSEEAVQHFSATATFYYFLPLADPNFPQGELFVIVGCSRTKTGTHPVRFWMHKNRELRARIDALPQHQRDEVLREGRWTRVDAVGPHGIWCSQQGAGVLGQTAHDRKIMGPFTSESAAREKARARGDELCGKLGRTVGAVVLYFRKLSLNPIIIR